LLEHSLCALHARHVFDVVSQIGLIDAVQSVLTLHSTHFPVDALQTFAPFACAAHCALSALDMQPRHVSLEVSQIGWAALAQLVATVDGVHAGKRSISLVPMSESGHADDGTHPAMSRANGTTS
jgi:hypothetical protein